MAKTNTQKIEGIQTQIQQLQNEQKRLMNLQKEAERKARTKRLIERGAILESLISGAGKYTNEQVKSFLEKTITTESARRILDGFTAQENETAAAESPLRIKSGGVSATAKNEIAGQDGG